MRIPLFVAFVAASLALPVAQASEVELHLKTGDDECVFITDTNGLTPKTGGSASPGALGATGNFSDACAGSSSQTPPSEAQIELLVPSSYVEGSTTPLALTWRASADFCELDLPSNWSGTPSQLCNSAYSCFVGGTADLTTTSGEGTYEVGLTCSRDGGNLVTKRKPVQVTVEDEDPPPPAGCPAQPLSRHSNGQIFYSPNGTINGIDTRYFHTVYGRTYGDSTTQSWPRREGSTPTFIVPRDKYLALEFTVPSVNAPGTGSVELIDSGMNPSIQSGKMSISECPGDFGQGTSALLANCKYDGSFGHHKMVWQTLAGTHSPCYLTPGKRYYLNFLSNCTSAECRFTTENKWKQVASAGELLGIEILEELSGFTD